MATFQVSVPNRSRYKDTPWFVTNDLRPFFGLWQPPRELVDIATGATVLPDAIRYRVRAVDIGNLDAIAYRQYGHEDLWWAIAFVNGIVDQVADMFEGQRLLIPPRDLVTRFTSRKSAARRN